MKLAAFIFARHAFEALKKIERKSYGQACCWFGCAPAFKALQNLAAKKCRWHKNILIWTQKNDWTTYYHSTILIGHIMQLDSKIFFP